MGFRTIIDFPIWRLTVPFIHMAIGIFKEWLVKYFFVHKIVLKAIPEF
jgi:hypothetical protein